MAASSPVAGSRSAAAGHRGVLRALRPGGVTRRLVLPAAPVAAEQPVEQSHHGPFVGDVVRAVGPPGPCPTVPHATERGCSPSSVARLTGTWHGRCPASPSAAAPAGVPVRAGARRSAPRCPGRPPCPRGGVLGQLGVLEIGLVRLVLAVHALQERPGALVLRVVDDRPRVPLLHDHPAVHEDDLVGHSPRERHLVRDDDHRHPALGQLAHDCEDLTDQLGVERRGRLVEEHQLGVHRERPGDRHALLLPTGELAGVGVRLVLQADPG